MSEVAERVLGGQPGRARLRRPAQTCAAVITAPRTVALREVPLLDPGPDEVRLRMEGCGVCGSNLPIWQGRPWFEYPLLPGEPGHEGWGVVEAAGSEVTAIREGDRVASLGGGAFADRLVVSAGSVLQVPRALDGLPAAGEPLACAMNVFRRAKIQPGETVAVVGIGFIGAAVARLAADAGAQVLAFSRRQFALDLARRLGAEAAWPSGDAQEAVLRAAELSHGRLCDCVIEAAGLQSTLDLAARLCRDRGRLVVAGYHQDGLRSVDMRLWNWRGLDVINAHEREPTVYLEGMRLAFQAVSSGRIDPRLLFTHRHPLASLSDAFRALEERPDGFLKGVVLA